MAVGLGNQGLPVSLGRNGGYRAYTAFTFLLSIYVDLASGRPYPGNEPLIATQYALELASAITVDH
jgi:hypothetical protein